ncbi:NB-ARC domain-containing protein [Scytonema sp. NUACC26]|uniref:NB-ARC domain-containing protein n=1 Tax=Scytonema sp. NUACC26 TaxID=3140176 RepID=UPI0034DC41F9
MPQKSIIANFQGETIGQLAVGNYVIDIGSSHGAMANIATDEERPTTLSRPAPVLVSEGSVDRLLGCQELVTEAIAALGVGQSVELYGCAGFGKTTLLSCLAHDIQSMSLFTDGVINLSLTHPYVSDLLQVIWEKYYQNSIPYKPTYREIKAQIQHKKALVVLDDDDELIQEELQELINFKSNLTFLIASSRKRLYIKGRSLPLSGLSLIDSISLVEKELGRSLTREEFPAAKSLCTLLKGHPVHIQIAVANIVEEGRSLAEIVSQLPSTEPVPYLIQQTVATLSKPYKTILELLLVMGRVGLKKEQISAIAQIHNADQLLETLQRRNLVQLQNSQYKITQAIAEVLPSQWRLTEILENAIVYFVKFAEQYQKQPNYLLVEIDATVQILEVAVRNSRWQDILTLVKAIESSLALSRRWSLWEQVLQRGLQASQAEQSRADEAWALHQLGVRALCLEENSTAHKYLTKAVRLRESLGDTTGVTLTNHNLNWLKNSSFPSSPNENQQIDVPDAAETNEQTKLQPPPPQLVTRLNLVSDNSSPSNNRLYQNTSLLSPSRVVTVGILASVGFLAWSNWHRFTPPPPQKTEPTTTITPSSAPKSEPSTTKTPLPKAVESVPRTNTQLTFPEHKPVINPPLTPKFDQQPSTIIKRQTPQIDTPPVPRRKSIPEPAVSATQQPPTTPTSTPTEEPTPTPTFSPSPSVESNPPIEEPTPTPTFTPVLTPNVAPTTSSVDTVPSPAVTVTPLENPMSSN